MIYNIPVRAYSIKAITLSKSYHNPIPASIPQKCNFE